MRTADMSQCVHHRFRLVFSSFVFGLLIIVYLTTRNTVDNMNNFKKTNGIHSSMVEKDISRKNYSKQSMNIGNLKPLNLKPDVRKMVELLHPVTLIHKIARPSPSGIDKDRQSPSGDDKGRQLPSGHDKDTLRSLSNIREDAVEAYPTQLDKNIVKGIEHLLNTPERCDKDTTLVVVICSAVEHYQKRQVIRETWGGLVSADMRIVFLVGTAQPLPAASTSNPLSNQTVTRSSAILSIEGEAVHYRDVIQADFIDSYSNLTIKSLAMLRWVSTYCSTIRFLLKCDDDVIINTPLLLRDLRDNAHRRFIMGNVIAYAQPVRQPNAKWYIPHSVYNRSSFPTYASGAGYIVSVDIVSELYSAGLTARTGLFRIEDVFVTGFLTRRIGAQLIYNGKFDGYKEFVDPCTIHRHIVRHKLSEEEMKFLWTVINKSPEECRNIYKSVFSTNL